MVAYYTATAPHHRGEARWYVTQTVELDQLKGVSSPRSLYHAIMGVTHGVRDMTPLSSEFVEDPLTIVRSPECVQIMMVLDSSQQCC